MDMFFFGDVIVYRYRYDLDHIFWLLMAADMPWSSGPDPNSWWFFSFFFCGENHGTM